MTQRSIQNPYPAGRWVFNRADASRQLKSKLQRVGDRVFTRVGIAHRPWSVPVGGAHLTSSVVTDCRRGFFSKPRADRTLFFTERSIEPPGEPDRILSPIGEISSSAAGPLSISDLVLLVHS
jgi:hypothetical protein